jgi:hypothetical protein
MTHEQQLWLWLPIGYLLSIAIETPILMLCLSDRHPLSRRLFAGVWLTACTYPIVALVLPEVFDVATQRPLYLLVAESVAHFGECALFWMAFGTKKEWGRRSMWQDFVAILLANWASFSAGEVLHRLGAFDFLVPPPAEPPAMLFLLECGASAPLFSVFPFAGP